MSWPTEEGRDPHVAYVVFDVTSQKYIRYINREEILWSEYLCYATAFATLEQAQSKIGNTPFMHNGKKVSGLLVKKIVLG